MTTDLQIVESLKSTLDPIQRNIIIGSLLGDGSLALYGRSKNAHYREHGCKAQVEYRQWKADMLESLGFKLAKNGKHRKLSSPSTELFTEVYRLFYINRVKIITHDNIQLLDHPIGLACLYMDDGCLVINPSHKKRSTHLSPQIRISTLCFSKAENILLQEHLNKTFRVKLKLIKRPNGKNTPLELINKTTF